jgi:hypothetical protein
MKNTAKALIFVGMMSLAASTTYAQVIVRVRPVRPHETVVITRGPAPSPRHVWVDEDWVERDGRYVWHGGYWAAPPRVGVVYVPGHWRDTRHGSIWVAGHWR